MTAGQFACDTVFDKGHCSAPGCDRAGRGNIDGGARACGMHYQRWVKFRSFELPKRRPHGLCLAPGCNCKTLSRNAEYCNTHYFRIKRQSRLGLAPVGGGCLRCFKRLTRNQSRFCSMRCATRHHHNVPMFRVCKVCNEPFDPKGKWEVCSERCHAERVRIASEDPIIKDRKAARGAKRRAILRGVQFEDFYPSEIYRRDKWICQICLTPVERKQRPPHYLSPSIDHIIPLCKGGPHRRFNVQCAHWICNLRKAKLPMRRLPPAQPKEAQCG